MEENTPSERNVFVCLRGFWSLWLLHCR